MKPRASVLTVLVASALFLIGGSWAALTADAVTTFTGCVNARTGALYNIAPGQQPRRACAKSDTLAQLAGGDITQVSAGTGLAGGGTNGGVTLSLATGMRLPQSCTTGQVPRWSGGAWECLTPSGGASSPGAGDGLELVGGTLRLRACAAGESPRFAIPGGWGCARYALAAQNCPAGQLAQGVTAGGRLSCARPTSGGSGTAAYFGTQVNPTQGGRAEDSVGIPSDNLERVYAAAFVPAGTYLVQATGELGSERNVDAFMGGSCRLNDRADERTWGSIALNDEGFTGSFALQGVIASNGGALSLICRATEGAPGISLKHARISALKVG